MQQVTTYLQLVYMAIEQREGTEAAQGHFTKSAEDLENYFATNYCVLSADAPDEVIYDFATQVAEMN